jgi:hypothetical protein
MLIFLSTRGGKVHLRVEVFQLLVPAADGGTQGEDILAAGPLNNLRQNIKDDIDAQFDRFIQPEKRKK